MKRVVGFHPAKASALSSELDSLASSFAQKGRISQPSPLGAQESGLSSLSTRTGRSIDEAASTGRGADFDCYAHRTRPRNLHAIREEGLVAGKSRGMGDPETGKPVTDAIFVATGRGALLDTAECAVGVVSAKAPEPDPNYKPDRRTGENPSGVFRRDTIPPLREADSGDPHMATTPYSFTLPMTPRTVAGVGEFVRQVTGQDVPDERAAKMIEDRFKTKFPLDHRASADRVGTIRKAERLDSESPPKRVRSDDNMFQMDL